MNRVKPFPEFVRLLPELDLPFPGARGWLFQGDGRQLVFVEFEETIDVPEHQHDEQWEFALDGRVELRMEGRTTEFGPGDNFFIPAGAPHGAKVHAGYKAMIVFNSPDRYRART